MQQTPDWFLTNGTWRLGPLTREHAIEALRRPEAGEVFAWREGMGEWVRADALPELIAGARPLAAPPPPIPPGWPGSHANQPGHIAYPSTPAAAPAVAAAQTRWFLVGTGKLLVMSVVTFGLYQIYWFYQHWKRVRDVHDEALSPLVRTIFTVIFCFGLFQRIADDSAERMTGYVPSAGAAAVGFIAISFCTLLPDPMGMIAMASVLALIPIQKAANAIAVAEAPTADPNTRLSGWNWFGVVVGGLLLLLAIVGMLLPDPPA